MKKTSFINILTIILSFPIFGFSQSINYSNFDVVKLNEYVLTEVNALRKKAKVDSLKNEQLLLPAAQDHTNYMLEKRKIGHFQKSKEKKNPKNRVDFYGQQFNTVGENVQQIFSNSIPKELKLKPRPENIENYEVLAKVLVFNWKNSPPHYANIIEEAYTTTFTTVSFGPKGEIYACQLFGSDAYTYPEEFDKIIYPYKPDNEKKCKRCAEDISLKGLFYQSEDNTVYYVSDSKKGLRKLVFRPWSDGIAMNIVLKDQFPCDGNNTYNGMSNARGIPIQPVFKKNFRKGDNRYRNRSVLIKLGQVPAWIDQEFEINLTIINNKRPCGEVILNFLPTYFYVPISLPIVPDTTSNVFLVNKRDTIDYRVDFHRTEFSFHSIPLREMLDTFGAKINESAKASIQGSASIEGATKENIVLYENRAHAIKEILSTYGCDTSSITISANENFELFRKDIVKSPFAYLNRLSDEEIKQKLSEQSLKDSIEYILKQHRYAKLQLYLNWNDTVQIDEHTILGYLKTAIRNENDAELKVLLPTFNQLVLGGKVHVNAIDELNIPKDKKHVNYHYDLLCLKALIQYKNDSLAAINFSKLKLLELQEFDPKNKEVNTHLAYLDYIHAQLENSQGFNEYFDEIAKKKYLNVAIQSRMLMNIALVNDYQLFYKMIWNQNGDYLHSDIKKWIKSAALTVDETFKIATYFTFFEDYKTAFDLTKNLIDDTDNPEHLVFFMKLIDFEDLGVTRKKYYSYFNRIEDLTGDAFCTYFNSPLLNFQILHDTEIKKIYCERCDKDIRVQSELKGGSN